MKDQELEELKKARDATNDAYDEYVSALKVWGHFKSCLLLYVAVYLVDFSGLCN